MVFIDLCMKKGARYYLMYIPYKKTYCIFLLLESGSFGTAPSKQ